MKPSMFTISREMFRSIYTVNQNKNKAETLVSLSPIPKQNPLENYYSHIFGKFCSVLDIITNQAEYDQCTQLIELTGSEKQVQFHLMLAKSLRNANSSFQHPLIDGHDYTDTILKATLVPVILTLTTIAATMMAIYNTLASIVCLSTSQTKLAQQYWATALLNLKNAFNSTILTLFSLVDGAIGCFTRPLLTVLRGFEKPRENNAPAVEVESVGFRFMNAIKSSRLDSMSYSDREQFVSQLHPIEIHPSVR